VTHSPDQLFQGRDDRRPFGVSRHQTIMAHELGADSIGSP
jgi:hypothetical protein